MVGVSDIIHEFRKHRQQLFEEHCRLSVDTATCTDSVGKIVDPSGQALDELWERGWEKNMVDAAIARVKPHLDPQEWRMFDFYVNKE